MNNLMPHGHPRSRDWGRDNFSCKQTSCIFNGGEQCVIPSKCSIGKDGTCEGYKIRESKKELNGD